MQNYANRVIRCLTMLQNEWLPLVAKIGFDTDVNETCRDCKNLANCASLDTICQNWDERGAAALGRRGYAEVGRVRTDLVAERAQRRADVRPPLSAETRFRLYFGSTFCADVQK